MSKLSLAALGLLLLVTAWNPTRAVSSTGNWESHTSWKKGNESSATGLSLIPITVAVGKVSSFTVSDCQPQGSEAVPLILFLIGGGEREPVLVIGEVYCASAAGEGAPLPEIIPLLFFIVPGQDPSRHYREFEKNFPLPIPHYELVPQDFATVPLHG